MHEVTLCARYLTDSQSVVSIEDQFHICREHAGRERWQAVDTYDDAAISGASVILRPGVQSLLQDASVAGSTLCSGRLWTASVATRQRRDVVQAYALRQRAVRTLAEGEILELRVGLKGTTDALFLKDLAAKTHRGFRGRVEKGRRRALLCSPNGDDPMVRRRAP
jgi:hypothetical protein